MHSGSLAADDHSALLGSVDQFPPGGAARVTPSSSGFAPPRPLESRGGIRSAPEGGPSSSLGEGGEKPPLMGSIGEVEDDDTKQTVLKSEGAAEDEESRGAGAGGGGEVSVAGRGGAGSSPTRPPPKKPVVKKKAAGVVSSRLYKATSKVSAVTAISRAVGKKAPAAKAKPKRPVLRTDSKSAILWGAGAGKVDEPPATELDIAVVTGAALSSEQELILSQQQEQEPPPAVQPDEKKAAGVTKQDQLGEDAGNARTAPEAASPPVLAAGEEMPVEDHEDAGRVGAPEGLPPSTVDVVPVPEEGGEDEGPPRPADPPRSDEDRSAGAPAPAVVLLSSDLPEPELLSGVEGFSCSSSEGVEELVAQVAVGCCSTHPFLEGQHQAEGPSVEGTSAEEGAAEGTSAKEGAAEDPAEEGAAEGTSAKEGAPAGADEVELDENELAFDVPGVDIVELFFRWSTCVIRQIKVHTSIIRGGSWSHLGAVASFDVGTRHPNNHGNVYFLVDRC